jgi:preprotein translocase SecE subunit
MAVAVKTSPGSRSAGTLSSPAILSLVGVLYLLGCMGIVFKLIPSLWWPAWQSMHLGVQFGGILLVVVCLAVGVGLLVLGGRLLGAHPPAGVRAGVFTAFVGVLIVVGLTRWASLWVEHWVIDDRWMSPGVGAGVTAAVGVVLLVAWVRLFTLPATQQYVLLFEQGGWFHATAYKPNQGQRVRRATIFGILLIVGAGIYTLISHNTLRSGNLYLNIPFTGRVAVESFGDAGSFLAALPAGQRDQVEVRSPGKSPFQENQVVSFAAYREAVKDLLADKPDLYARLEKAGLDKDGKENAVLFLEEQNRLVQEQMNRLLELNVFRADATRRLQEEGQRTDRGDADLTKLIASYQGEAEKGKRTDELGPLFRLPTAVLVVDRYAMRGVNDETSPNKNVRVTLRGDSSFPVGAVVTREAFDEEVDKLEADRKKGRDRELPEKANLASASGILTFERIPLLPGVEYTVPLLLLAASLWLAWRVVNMPSFADFLIATEAELNKVSWTTQKRLVQDTIVVLVTVALMAVFLFTMDWTWKVVLSWEPIGVLHIPKEQSDTKTKIEERNW